MIKSELTTVELECELLRASNSLRVLVNNLSAFHLRANIATTADAKADAQGSILYYERLISQESSYIQDLKSTILIRDTVYDLTMTAFRFAPVSDLRTGFTHNSSASR